MLCPEYRRPTFDKKQQHENVCVKRVGCDCIVDDNERSFFEFCF